MKIFELAKEFEEMKPLEIAEFLKNNGFDSVKSHMSSLADEDVEKARTLLAKKDEPEESAKTTKKKAKKKKAAKKKVAKKKVTKKADTKSASGDDASAEETDKPKKTTTRRKKTVIRRKSGEEDKVEEPAEAEVLQTESTPATEEATEVTSEAAPAEVSEEETDSSGLRVVSRPAEEAQEVAEEAPASKEDKDSDIYREKVHKFTPVFIPEKKEVDETKKQASSESGGESSSDSDDDQKKSADSTKKRMGGLASLMSGKKANVSKSQTLTEQRADSELKNYAALSSTGRPIYTQAKRKRIYSGPSKETELTEVKDSKKIVNLHGGGTIKELAKKLSVKVKELGDKTLEMNLLIKSEDYVGIKLASQIAALYGYRVEDKAFNEDEVIGKVDLSEDQKSNLPLRNPIITVMGHVDHGKTTLIDHIRDAKVVDGEAGGITQHIGAYSVEAGGKTLTFLDTPGHAAFASMRQRGADVTDIVILVVAADDGVMPQTKESIKFCQNANKPVIVAVNKMDKEEANPDRVKTELAENGIQAEDWGGDIQFCPISALKGDGIDELLDAVALQAEILELRADPKGQGEGIVIESKVEQGRGPVATILVETGTLKKGDNIVVGETYGRARSLTNHVGKQIPKAGPSMPVQILGLAEPPKPGDVMNVVKNEREAKKIAQNRAEERKKLDSGPVKKKVSLEDFFANAAPEGEEQKMLNLIIRTDVQGSFEAIKQSLEPLGTDEVGIKILGGGVGPITDSDVQLADSASAIIIGFNMRPMNTSRRLAEQKGIDIKTYSIIYELINDVKLALEGLLEPEYEEKFIGRAEVKDTFSVPRVGTIAGCQVVDGGISIGCNIRLLRSGKIMFDGKLNSLKRFKDDVKEVKNGYECGMGLEGYNDVKVGDVFEAYLMEEKKRTLEDAMKAQAESEAAAAAAAKAAAAAEAAEAQAAAESESTSV
ncbi:MAG: translation initiation factor IF-2 [Bacteriovoracaceae bacterium]|nr:translation initiation factor IF-2 [Bacteriovoracaceae bacterium]